MAEVEIRTEAHRRNGSAGIVVRFDATAGLPAVATEWKLARGGEWTTANLGTIQRMLDEHTEGSE